MFELIVISAVVLPMLVRGLVTWLAMRRARPQDIPRLLEIYARTMRQRGSTVADIDTVAEIDAGGEEDDDAGQEPPTALP